MKEINIGKIIYQKRKEKQMTQEDLANYLNITKAAISKWESNQSYPDITLLPTIASLFNISIDDLIDYKPQMHKEDIKKLYFRLAKEFTTKPFDEVYQECLQIITKYYSCFELLLQMIILLLNHVNLASNPQKVYEYLNNLCKHIIAESKDVYICHQVKQLQALILLSLNQPIEIIDNFPEMKQPLIFSDTIIANAYKMIGKDKEAAEILQIYQYQYILTLIQNITNYIYFNSDDSKLCKQATKRLLKLIEIYDLTNLNPPFILSIYVTLSMIAINHNEEQLTLNYLKEYVNTACKIKFPISLSGDDYFDLIGDWLNQLDLGPLAPRDDQLVIKSIQETITSPIFEPIKNNVEYIQLLNQLNQHLGEYNHEH